MKYLTMCKNSIAFSTENWLSQLVCSLGGKTVHKKYCGTFPFSAACRPLKGESGWGAYRDFVPHAQYTIESAASPLINGPAPSNGRGKEKVLPPVKIFQRAPLGEWDRQKEVCCSVGSGDKSAHYTLWQFISPTLNWFLVEILGGFLTARGIFISLPQMSPVTTIQLISRSHFAIKHDALNELFF
jgi:hypothetical protein